MPPDFDALEALLAPYRPQAAQTRGSTTASPPTEGGGCVPDGGSEGPGDSEIYVPGSVPITETARRLYELQAARGRLYLRGGTVVEVEPDVEDGVRLVTLNAAAARSRFEDGVQWIRPARAGDIPAVLSEMDAKALLEARERDRLPKLEAVLDAPMLVEREGELVCLTHGYNSEERVWVTGRAHPDNVALDEARGVVMETLLADFQFATPADQGRAIAALLTPGLNGAGLIPGRIGLCILEANASQTGKGYYVKLISAVYGQIPTCLSKGDRGVGSLDESFDQALIWGRPIISLENVRGQINSQKIESFLTEPTYLARVPYSRGVFVDPVRFSLFMTSNGAELTEDLANRALFIRLRKREACQFRTYPEGDLIAHVRARQTFFQGCAFSLIRSWHAAGKPRTDEVRHDKRAWIQICDWIVQRQFNLPPIMDGHVAVRDRSAMKFMGFVRQLAISVERRNRLGQYLRCGQLFTIALEQGLEVPCMRPGCELDDDLGARAMGMALSSALGEQDQIQVDEYKMIRQELEPDEISHHRHRVYVFEKQ